jgi:hypothetical protein
LNELKSVSRISALAERFDLFHYDITHPMPILFHESIPMTILIEKYLLQDIRFHTPISPNTFDLEKL